MPREILRDAVERKTAGELARLRAAHAVAEAEQGRVKHDRLGDAAEGEVAADRVGVFASLLPRGALEGRARELGGVEEVRGAQVLVHTGDERVAVREARELVLAGASPQPLLPRAAAAHAVCAVERDAVLWRGGIFSGRKRLPGGASHPGSGAGHDDGRKLCDIDD